MKLETFFEKFEQFADAPGAVGKMRELTLKLAVTGRLVNQSPNDDPVDALAITISNDRAAFVRSRNLARQREFAPVAHDQCPFDLPPGWVWTRLGNICRAQAGFAFQSTGFVQGDSGVPMIRIRDITNDNTQVNYVGEYREEFLVDAGDYLVGMDGNFKVAKWCGPRALLNQRVSRLQWYSQHLEPSFFAIAAQYRLSELQGTKAYTTVDHLSSGQIENAVVPLPPLAEQKRIVAKVDELMALCDRLEAQQQEREARHAALVRASLARFADAPTPANLQYLFHPSYTIAPADLRKTILTLAVQGKLVPQDPNDEPADTLNRKLPKQLLAIAEEVGARFTAPTALVETSDDLPPGWGSAAIRSIGITQTGTTPSKSESSFTGRDIPFIKPGDIQGDAIDYDNEGLSADGLNAGRLVPKNSILMVSIGGSIGKTAIVDRDVSCNQQINSVSPAECVEPRFVLTAIRSGDFQSEVMSRAAQGTLPIISKGKWETIRIPIPPLAEQRRIVAKVDQLMALVEQLEEQLAASRATAANLLSALVAELTARSAHERHEPASLPTERAGEAINHAA